MLLTGVYRWQALLSAEGERPWSSALKVRLRPPAISPPGAWGRGLRAARPRFSFPDAALQWAL